MKKNTTNKFHDLRKRIISILASNAFKAATLTPLALAMVACKTETDSVTEKEDVITLNNFKINIKKKFKVGETITTEEIGKGVFVDLFINGEKIEEISLKDLFDKYKNTNTFNINVKVKNDKGEDFIYTITNNSFPTQVYEFNSEENNFIVSGQFNDVSFDASLPFTVGPKEQGGQEPGKDPNEKPEPGKEDPVTPPVTGEITKEFDSLRELFVYVNKPIPEGEQQTGTITLTAQTIKKLAALPSDLKITIPADTKEEEKETKIKEIAIARYEKYKDLSTLVNAYDNGEIKVEKNGIRDIGNDYGYIQNNKDTKNVIPANNLGIFIELYPPVNENKVESYKISKGNIVLDGTFNYNEIDIENNGASISADNAVFSMKQPYKKNDLYFVMSPKAVFDIYTRLFNYDSETLLKEVITQPEKLREMPTLDYYIHGQSTDKDISDSIIALHKIYYTNKDKLKLDESIDTFSFKHYADGEKKSTRFEFQGADFFKDGETMFKENSINTDNTIPNMSVDILREVSTKYNVGNIKNLLITGDYKEAKDESVDINSELTNVVFTGDVSGLKNSEEDQFNGVVYFMDKPYNNIDGNKVGPVINGLLKLDKLEGVSYDTFRVNNGVLDLRGRDGLDHNPLKGYNIETDSKKSINYSGHDAIYFTKKYINDIENIDRNSSSIEKTFETLTRRVGRVDGGGTPIHNVYIDDEKYDSIIDNLVMGLSSDAHAVSKTPRTLEEFEYYGNNGKYKTPARDSYTNDEFKQLGDTIKEKLDKDKNSGANQIVLNNRKIDFIDPETKKIIFSVLNDRQYNA